MDRVKVLLEKRDNRVTGSYGEDVGAGGRLLADTLQLGLHVVDDAEAPQ